MPDIEHRALFGQDRIYLESDIRSLAVINAANGQQVVAMGGPNGGLTNITLDETGQAMTGAQTALDISNLSQLGSRMATIDVSGTQVLIVGTSASGDLLGYEVDDSGNLGASTFIDVGGVQPTSVVASSVSDHLFVATANGQVFVFSPDQHGHLQSDAEITVGQDSLLILETATMGQREFLLVLSEAAAGVSAFEVDPQTGNLTESGSLGAQDGLGIHSMPVGLNTAQIAGKTYLIVASTAEESQGAALSVMELGADGTLRATDHVLDTLATRFSKVQGLEVVEYDGFVYVVAAGGDEGISLFSLLPGGRLAHLDTIENAAGFGLGSISAMTVVPRNGALEIILASQDAPGLTQFSVSLDAQGDIIRGNISRLNGTADDDVLIGGAGKNALFGGAGDDLLIDGHGRDTLTGGAGRDTFMLEADGAADTITDFKAGVDRIDLSLYPMVYSTAQVRLETTATGVRLTARGETTDITAAGARPISVKDVRDALVFGAGRTPIVKADDIRGTANADSLQGTEDNDTIFGLNGNDYLKGLSGNDWLSGGAGNDTLRGDAGDDVLNGDEGNDRLQGNDGADTLSGGDGDDHLMGGGNNDLLIGGAGNDRLEGHKGFDILRGGDGDDLLRGGAHADTLWGENGNDRLLGEMGHDTLDGGAGNDELLGGNDHDTLIGGAGDDILLGGANRDLLQGGDGDDFLNGQNGFDRLEGGVGNDILIGEANADVMLGGDGDDRLDGGNGFDRLEGGNGHDILLGGANADKMFGDAGNDRLYGQVGHDRLEGGAGDDYLDGGIDFDLLIGGDGNDTLLGGAHRDVLRGGDGDDFLNGQNGFDRLEGGAGNDTLIGEANADTMLGGDGNDYLDGGNGFDRLEGGNGNDTLLGGLNADEMLGGAGDDVLEAGRGLDVMTGGSGADAFVFRNGDEFNRVTDFQNGVDILHLYTQERDLSQLEVHNGRYGLVVRWDGGQVILEGMTASMFDASDVDFL